MALPLNEAHVKHSNQTCSMLSPDRRLGLASHHRGDRASAHLGDSDHHDVATVHQSALVVICRAKAILAHVIASS